MFLCVCWWSISIGSYTTSFVVFSMVKIGSESMEIKYFRMDYTSRDIFMVTGRRNPRSSQMAL
jgi:hypothetical protein